MNALPSQPAFPLPNVAVIPLGVDGRDPVDVTLVRQMSLGDEEALGALYDRWHPLVNAVAVRILRQRSDVEDVVEEVFWQAWRQAGRLEATRGTVHTWLLTIARSRALGRVRSQTRLREEPLEREEGDHAVVQTADGDPSLDAESAERRRIMLAALSVLSLEQRETLELAYFGGLSESEIAERTGQPLGAIKMRMRLAMQKLKGHLLALHQEVR